MLAEESPRTHELRSL